MGALDESEALTVVLIVVVATILIFLLFLIIMMMCRLRVEQLRPHNRGSMITALAAVLSESVRSSLRRQRPPTYDQAVATVSSVVAEQNQAPPAYSEAVKGLEETPEGPEEPPPYSEEEEQHI